MGWILLIAFAAAVADSPDDDDYDGGDTVNIVDAYADVAGADDDVVVGLVAVVTVVLPHTAREMVEVQHAHDNVPYLSSGNR